MKEFVFTITKGWLPEHTRYAVWESLQGHEGKQVVLSLKAWKKTRSNRQNRYLRGPVVAQVQTFLNERGANLTKLQTHKWLKMRFGNFHELAQGPDGELIEMERSTAELTTVEMEDYLTAIRAGMAEMGCQIAEPNEGN